MPTTSSGDVSFRVLKVAQVVGNPSGGVMSCVMNYFRNVDRQKVQFDFYTYSPSPYDDEIRSLGGNVFHFPNVFNPKSAKVLEEQFKQNGYDVVHAHLTTRSGFALKAAKRAGVAVRICHAHSTAHFSEGLAFLAKTLLKPHAKKYATHFAGCSKRSAEWLFGTTDGVFLMKNALDLTRFCYRPKPFSEVKTVGFVGRFVFQKNLFFLLDVFKRLSELRNDVKLVLVGDGKDKQKLQKKAKKICGDKIVFAEERSDVENCYATFDLFLLPSRFEGMPLVAVEAQACGAPCLISDVVSEEADVGNAQFLPLGDVELWAQAACRALDGNRVEIDGERLRSLGYDVKEQAPELLRYYQSITSKQLV